MLWHWIHSHDTCSRPSSSCLTLSTGVYIVTEGEGALAPCVGGIYISEQCCIMWGGGVSAGFIGPSSICGGICSYNERTIIMI